MSLIAIERCGGFTSIECLASLLSVLFLGSSIIYGYRILLIAPSE